LDGLEKRTLLDHGVETVDRVGSVVNSTTGTIRVVERVLAVDDVSAARFHLTLGISGDGILHVVTERILRIGIVLGVDYGLHDGDLSVGYGMSDDRSSGDGYQSGEDEELSQTNLN
jgi:hypothetical protein